MIEADRMAGRLRYSRVSPGSRAGIVEVRISAAQGGSRIEVAYDMTSLDPKGDAAVAAMDAPAFAGMMREWERLIASAIASGADSPS